VARPSNEGPAHYLPPSGTPVLNQPLPHLKLPLGLLQPPKQPRYRSDGDPFLFPADTPLDQLPSAVFLMPADGGVALESSPAGSVAFKLPQPQPDLPPTCVARPTTGGPAPYPSPSETSVLLQPLPRPDGDPSLFLASTPTDPLASAVFPMPTDGGTPVLHQLLPHLELHQDSLSHPSSPGTHLTNCHQLFSQCLQMKVWPLNRPMLDRWLSTFPFLNLICPPHVWPGPLQGARPLIRNIQGLQVYINPCPILSCLKTRRTTQAAPAPD